MKEVYIHCVISGFLGIMFHIAAVKMPALKRRSKAANKPFEPLSVFKDDWLGIAASGLTVIITTYLLEEFAGFSPYIMQYVKFFFVAVGFMGSSFLLSVLSKADKAINKVIDRKSNIADDKEFLNNDN